MRFTAFITVMICFAFGGSALAADAALENELKQLIEKNNKEVTAALDAINRRYLLSLQKLLDQARKANAVETVAKIKEAIDVASIPPPPFPNLTEPLPPPSPPFAIPAPEVPNEKPALEPPPRVAGKAQFPSAKAVPGKPGFVISPYAPDAGYIDVRGFPPGMKIKDPYSGKTFLVP